MWFIPLQGREEASAQKHGYCGHVEWIHGYSASLSFWIELWSNTSRICWQSTQDKKGVLHYYHPLSATHSQGFWHHLARKSHTLIPICVVLSGANFNWGRLKPIVRNGQPSPTTSTTLLSASLALGFKKCQFFFSSVERKCKKILSNTLIWAFIGIWIWRWKIVSCQWTMLNWHHKR